MDIYQIISKLEAEHYQRIKESLQVKIPSEETTMNPKLTANLRAEAELKAQVQQQQFTEVSENLKTALSWLENAHCLMNSSRLNESHSELYTVICDALRACREGVNQSDSQSDGV